VEGVRYLTLDVTDAAQVKVTFSSFERVDVLVNNAGIQRVGMVGEQPVDEWLKVIATNLSGPYFCSREVLACMPDGGAIVFVASVAALVGLPGRSAYSAAKAGLLGLTRVMSVELASRRIRVNAVCPGFTSTPLIQQGIDDGSLETEWMLERVPLARLAEPREIADAVRFLASDEATFITGQGLVIDGGWSVQGVNRAPDWLSHAAVRNVEEPLMRY
jgi:NAD(P)-dependent dehydrogenase (short-subunit alcohol dehydrogenase family)